MGMTAVRFKIGEAFPAADPVARFVTVLAMMSNDWMRLAKQMQSQQVSLLVEAAKFIRDAQKRFPELDAFVAALPARARKDRDRVVGAIDPTSKRYRGRWVEDLRNVTFHYPEMQPNKAAHGKEEASVALTKAATLTSTIDAGDFYFGEARFHFADEVVVQWIPEKRTRKALR